MWAVRLLVNEREIANALRNLIGGELLSHVRKLSVAERIASGTVAS